MTTIVVRNGIMAADSRTTVDSEAGGSRVFICEKLYRKTVSDGRRKRHVIIGLAGESAPGLVFLDWYGSKAPPPAFGPESDKHALMAASLSSRVNRGRIDVQGRAGVLHSGKEKKCARAGRGRAPQSSRRCRRRSGDGHHSCR